MHGHSDGIQYNTSTSDLTKFLARKKWIYVTIIPSIAICNLDLASLALHSLGLDLFITFVSIIISIMVKVLSSVVVASVVVNAATTAPQGKTSQDVVAAVGRAAGKTSFDPYSYKKKYTTCKAVERAGGTEKKIDLKLAYLDINPTANRTLIMVHGWPSLWTTYRHQITDLGKEYRIILPEHRGYGDSEHPKDLQDSNAMFDVSVHQKMVLNAIMLSGHHSLLTISYVCWMPPKSNLVLV